MERNGMSQRMRMEFKRPPSALWYMARSLYPSPGLGKKGEFPAISASWKQCKVDNNHLQEFLSLTGLRGEKHLPLLYPYIIGFRLQMAVLTHPAFPLPVWKALQVRIHLLQRQPIPRKETLDFETCIGGWRVLEKGMEVDLASSVSVGGDKIWESRITFFIRGNFGAGNPPSELAQAPQAGRTEIAEWHMPSGVGWRFGRLTGDYNGIHIWRGYARLFGYRRAFHHPQIVLGQIMARLTFQDQLPNQRLDAWLKGPIFYDSDVRLDGTINNNNVTFALFGGDEERPGFIGHWYQPETGKSLFNR